MMLRLYPVPRYILGPVYRVQDDKMTSVVVVDLSSSHYYHKIYKRIRL